jgi:NADPH-dependent ferric siderophore reductase
MSDLAVSRHQISRVRRETRRRLVTVAEVERITPQMLRIRFTSPDLHDFGSASPDDHIKLFLAVSAEPGEAAGHCMRDYTPRSFDPERRMLTIDFALHEEAGPATAWALAARVGDRLEIGGPRGSSIVADDFDWYLLIGDETALPAIGRRVEELRSGVAVTTVVVIDSDAERQTLVTRASWMPVWISRENKSLDDAALIRLALSNYARPPGDGYVWIAAEARTARALRSHFIETLGHPKAWLKASGYWKLGEANIHENIQD